MKEAIEATKKYFESASEQTQEYRYWHWLFKKEFVKFLKERGVTAMTIAKPNHFDMSGFFTINNQIWYFRIEDLRWSKTDMLIRTAKSYQDYTGGKNEYICLLDYEMFIQGFDRVVGTDDAMNLAN